MTSNIFEVKRKDTAVKFQDHLAVGGVSVDLTDASVALVLRARGDDSLVWAKDARILQTGIDQDTALANVEWLPDSEDDLDLEPGHYEMEWHLTLRGGKKLTLPRNNYLKIRIIPRISDF
jgi:hypothetical protein